MSTSSFENSEEPKKKAHPAKYSDALLPVLKEALEGYTRILDPMAGTGKLREIRPDAYLLEIEPEWAEMRGATVGDALALPWPDGFFDAICTSPSYGNRMADHHEAKDKSKRNTYRHILGRELHPHNSGQLQWGRAYREFHYLAWKEVKRVLRPEGRFVLNISNHIRKGKLVPVTDFHFMLLYSIGFESVKSIKVKTPRQKQGQNGEKRVEYESVLIFKKKKIFTQEYENFSEFEEYWPSLERMSLDGGIDRFSYFPISGQEKNNENE
jgi:SAM-dependent methyltransferase